MTDDQQAPQSTPSPVPLTEENEGAGAERRKKDASHEGRLKEELKRQKVLLDESRKRLAGMIKDGSDRKRVRDHLEEIQKELSKKVEKWSAKKQREPKGKGYKGKSPEQDEWKKEEKKKWKGEKVKKHSKEEEKRKGKEDKKKEQKPQKENSHKEAWRKHQDEWERKKGERRKDREERRKEKPWHSRSGKNPHQEHPHHKRQQKQQQQHSQNDFWSDQEQKLRRNIRPLGCSSVEDCATKEGLYPVELQEFEELLEGYLSKLERSSSESKDKIWKLTAEFFEDGVFVHDRVLFSDFAEDVADILEDMVDVLEGGGKKKDDSLEEAMEEFEREALWKFAATP